MPNANPPDVVIAVRSTYQPHTRCHGWQHLRTPERVFPRAKTTRDEPTRRTESHSDPKSFQENFKWDTSAIRRQQQFL
jgi:hypothetical protein